MKDKLLHMVDRLRIEAIKHQSASALYGESNWHGMAGEESGKRLAKLAIIDQIEKILAEENEENNSGQ